MSGAWAWLWDGARGWLRRRWALALGVVLAAAGHALVLGWGWPYWRLDELGRREHPLYEVLQPAGGAGQLLGLAGLLCMLLTLLYWARKLLVLLPRLPRLPSTEGFLALHVGAGLLAPVFVLEHCGLSFEGLPGIAALGLLLVAVTGGFGRRPFGLLAARAERERGRSVLSGGLLLRASVGAHPDHPDAPDPAVAEAVALLEALPVGGSALLTWLRDEWRGWRVARGVERSLTQSACPSRVVDAMALELREAIAARRTLRRVDLVRRLVRWWRLAHIALSHAVLVLAGLHAWVALSYSGTWERVGAFLGSSWGP